MYTSNICSHVKSVSIPNKVYKLEKGEEVVDVDAETLQKLLALNLITKSNPDFKPVTDVKKK